MKTFHKLKLYNRFNFLCFFVFCFAMIHYYSYSQSSGWNIQSLRRPLTSIHRISSSNYWIFGGDIAYKSTDSGNTWSNPIRMNIPIGILSEFDVPLSNSLVFFVNSQRGWACQYHPSLTKTTNGGNSWTYVSTGTDTTTQLQTIYFVNQNTGWSGGWNPFVRKGIIIKTTNGGVNWIVQANQFYAPVRSIWMLDTLRGFFLNDNDSLGFTVDGGNNWMLQKAIDGQALIKIFFTDHSNGWISGSNYSILKTTNSGNNWALITDIVGNNINMFFLNTGYGWITGNAKRIWKTTDGGFNWNQCLGSADFDYKYYNYILDMNFRDINTGWALMGNGTVLKSINGGLNWYNEKFPPHGDVISLNFSDVSTGLASSNYADGWSMNSSNNGFIWKTTDCGCNWEQKLVTNDNEYISRMAFVNSLTGFACGNNKIYKTEDFGNNWAKDSIGNNIFNCVNFIDQCTGWVCGKAGSIYKTINCGQNWIQENSGTFNNFNSVVFTDINNGFAGTDSGAVYKSTNGGYNWNFLTNIGGRNITQIYFINSLSGFIVANRPVIHYDGFYTNRLLLKTADSGNTWIPVLSDTIYGYQLNFNNVFFINENNGWLVSSRPEIKHSTNAGNTWVSESVPVQEKYYGVFFLNNETGWVSGSMGSILSKGIPPLGLNNYQRNLPDQFLLYQNYPNPFNPTATIRYDLPKDAKVLIKVYDIIGREVRKLVDEFKKAGSYTVSFDGTNLASGIYFYRIEAGDFVQTKKMVLIK